MIQTKVELVTPEMAAHYLKRNVDNYRKLSKTKVAIYAQAMKAGKWQLNGEGIVFDQEGKLKNGQHRLAAVIASNTPVQLLIVNGVDNETNVYDVGMVRSLSQIANAAGAMEVNTTQCAVANLIVGNWGRISKSVAVDYIVQHAGELKRASRLCGASTRDSLGRRTSCVLAAYISARTMKSYELEVFFKVFNSGNVIGTDGYEPSPALVARRMFMERYRGRSNNLKETQEQVDILLMALNDFVKGKKRQVNYRVSDPLICIGKMNDVRKEDGLE